ncbi:MAG TPA: hypothetical protein VD833_06375 [Vicinamibacterales bacterium]|nr:hypothetical protein [Vicinamibacterales bacterium]
MHHPPAIEAWLRSACADAERRGLPALAPLLESLARSTAALREADLRVLGPGSRPPLQP